MNKSLYSLMLSDDVVREIDRLALRSGVSRSALVNRVLAEYAGVRTPEMQIDSIFRQVEQLLEGAGEIVPFFTRGQQSMTMKSSLEYKYRPTVKYAVQLYKGVDNLGRFGELTINFRTQSRELLDRLAAFFGYWKLLEDQYLAPRFPAGAIDYALQDGRFVRTLALPQGSSFTSEEIGDAITGYVRTFDMLLKAWLAESLDYPSLEQNYVKLLQQAPVMI